MPCCLAMVVVTKTLVQPPITAANGLENRRCVACELTAAAVLVSKMKTEIRRYWGRLVASCLALAF